MNTLNGMQSIIAAYLPNALSIFFLALRIFPLNIINVHESDRMKDISSRDFPYLNTNKNPSEFQTSEFQTFGCCEATIIAHESVCYSILGLFDEIQKESLHSNSKGISPLFLLKMLILQTEPFFPFCYEMWINPFQKIEIFTESKNVHKWNPIQCVSERERAREKRQK